MFSLKSLFFRKASMDLQQKKQKALQPARENFIKLKNLLASREYRIIKSEDEGNYHLRKTRTIGLTSAKNNLMNLKNEPTFLRVLFTLAHETGHALQWTEDGSKIRLTDKMDEMYDHLLRINNTTPSWTDLEAQDQPQWNRLTELYDFWYELDAWIKGMKFIPPAYHNMYKKYAQQCYSTYMTHYVKKNLSRFILELRMLDYSK